MTLLLFPIRVAGSVAAWVLGAAGVVFIEAGLTGGHPPQSWLIAVPVLALGVGVVTGATFWQTSKRRPVPALVFLVGLFLVVAAIGVVSGSRAVHG